MRTVRSFTRPTETWNPADNERDMIRYVDVSGVSRETLSITIPAPISTEGAPSRARKIVRADDTIFATIRPGLRRVAKVPRELDGEIVSTAFCILRPDTAQVDPDYLFFLASSDRFVASVAEHETGASYPAVRDRDVLDQHMELPTIEEQHRIAAALRAVWSSVTKEIELSDLARDLKSAAMRELFRRGLRGEAQKDTAIGLLPASWDFFRFSDVRESLQYGTSVHCTLEKKRYPVLRIPNVESGRVNGSELKYCDLPETEASKYILHEGDLLFIRTNGVLDRLGSCAVYRGEPQTALFASYLIRARLKQNVDARYIAYFYASALGSSLVAGRATPAADGKYNLNTGTIDSLPLPLPASIDEQREIVAILDALDRKIDLHRQKRTVLEELFKSLLHKLMTGEIRIDELDLSALSVAPIHEPEAAA